MKGAVVKLINTDGMALIGPGSEWFWTALTGLILAITFFAIYRQLSIARSATAFDQLTSLETELYSERMTRMGLDVLLALRGGVDPAHLPESSAASISGYWERVGGLVRRGHLDAKLLWDGSGGISQAWWVVLEPRARRVRVETGPAYEENFEWLAGVMAELGRQRGSKLHDWASIMASLDSVIEEYRGRLRLEEALRSVTTATVDPSPAVAPSLPSTSP
jgi:hypothetical protein